MKFTKKQLQFTNGIIAVAKCATMIWMAIDAIYSVMEYVEGNYLYLTRMLLTLGIGIAAMFYAIKLVLPPKITQYGKLDEKMGIDLFFIIWNGVALIYIFVEFISHVTVYMNMMMSIAIIVFSAICLSKHHKNQDSEIIEAKSVETKGSISKSDKITETKPE